VVRFAEIGAVIGAVGASVVRVAGSARYSVFGDFVGLLDGQ
jgi:hypothetical protein